MSPKKGTSARFSQTHQDHEKKSLRRQLCVGLIIYSVLVQSIVFAAPPATRHIGESNSGSSYLSSVAAQLSNLLAEEQPATEQQVPDLIVTAFGPKKFTRTHGAPNNYVETFTVPSSCALGTYKIVVKNGEENGTNRISSAQIKLNSVSLYVESDFNQNTYQYQKPVTLAAENTLEIRLASPPNSYLTVEIVGENCGPVDTVPPRLIITSPEDNAATSGQTIAVSGTAEDLGEAASGVRQVLVNNNLVPYDPSTKVWTASAVQLSTGSNVVTVRAIDNAGNESTSQVTIIRDVTQPSVSISSPSNGSVILSSSITVSGTASDGGTDTSGLARVTVNGAEATVNLVSGEWTIPNVSLGLGSNTITVVAYDRAGNQTTSQIAVTRVVNQPPTANAGADQTIELPNSASLSGTANDDGYPANNLSVSWAKVSGDSSVVFSNPNSLNTSASFGAAGTFVLRLSVSDGLLSTIDEVTVVVHPANQAPTANAGNDGTIELPNSASLVGTVSDDGYPLGSSLAVTWSKVSGTGNVTFSAPSAASTSAQFSAPGVYVLRLTASDGVLETSDEVTITVKPENHAPVVEAGANQTIEFPNLASLNGTATDDGFPEGSSLVIGWSKISGDGDVVFANSSALTTTAAFSQPGTYVLRLNVSDGPLYSSDDVTVVVAPTNHAPTVSAGDDQTITLPTDVALLNGAATDDGFPSGSSVSITWSKISGEGDVAFSDLHAPTTTATFALAGTYVLRLAATDGFLSASDDLTVTVLPPNQAPTVDAGADQTVDFGTEVFVQGSVTDDGFPSGSTLTSTWSLVAGPGTATFGNVNSLGTSVTFSQGGSYVLRLTATDGELSTSDEIAVSVVPQTPEICEDANAGTDFWMTFPSAFLVGTRSLDILIASDVATSGTVTVPRMNLSFPFTVAAGSIASIRVPSNVSLSSYDVAENKGIRVVAQSKVTVSIVDFANDTNDSTIVVPVQTLGDSYHILAQDGSSQLAVVAPSDATTITITPSSATGSHPAGVPFTKLLNSGQAYQLTAGSGSIVTSNKPVAVFAGATCANVPSDVSACNVLLEQMLPTNMLGKDFVTVPFAARTGDMFRIMATQDQTEVRMNGALLTTLNKGQIYSSIVRDPSYITATKPVSINQLSTGQRFEPFPGYGVGGIGDPSMTVVPPFETFLSEYQIAVPTYGFMERYVNIVAPASVAGTIRLDGNLIPIQKFIPAGNSGFFVTQIEVTTGYHRLTGDAPFGLMNYGFSNFDARSTPGGIGRRKACTPNDTTAPSIILDNTGGAPVNELATEVTGFVGDQNSVKVTVNGIWAAVKGNRFSARVPLSAGANSINVIATDVDGNTSTASMSIVRATTVANTAPRVLAGPKQTLRDRYEMSLSPLVYDDGPAANLTYTWTKISGPGTINFQNFHAARGKAYASIPGNYVLRLTVSDGQFTVSDDLNADVLPEFSADLGPNQTITLPSTATVSLLSLIYDTELPNNRVSFVVWQKRNGPGTVTFGNLTSPTTTATFSAPGVYELWLSVSMTEDSTITGKLFVTVNPAPANQPPVVEAGPNQTISLPSSAVLAGTVTDDGLPTNNLTLSWTKTSGPGTVAFSNPSSAQTSASFSQPGTYVLRLTANDGQATRFDELTVTVNPENHAPTIQIGPDQTITLSQTAVLEAVSIVDDGVPVNAVYTYQWSKVSGPGNVTFSNPTQTGTYATFSQTGVYTVRLTVSDSLLTGSDDMIVTVQDAQPAPVVEIASPDDGSAISAPTAFTGSVSSGVWKLEYSLDETDNASQRTWTQFANGSGAASGNLGSLDTTLMLNGLYDVRLTSIDQYGQTGSETITIIVENNLKVGNFTVSFDDMNVPVNGIPMQIIRTYDSRDKRPGDFGVGWTLGIRNIRVEKNRTIGLNWQQTSDGALFPTYCVAATRPHIVTVTMPDGNVEKFEAKLQQMCQQYAPVDFGYVVFQPLSGARGKLEVIGDNYVALAGSVPGPMEFVAFTGGQGIFDSASFKYTSKDGTQFTLRQGVGLEQVRDLDGNTLTINASGIHHSSGVSISFTRDALGRITNVTDPKGEDNVYEYDAAGDLVSYTDRENNETTFTYEPQIPHHLKTIVDPLGRTGIRNDYDSNGRLIKHTDADGNEIIYTHDLAARVETIRDRMGNPTVLEYDGRGNVLKRRDALNHETTFSYDSNDNLLSETNQLGKTTSYTYDAFDNRTSVTDPLGNKTEFTFNNLGQVLTIKDARGKITTNTYSPSGQLLTTTDPLGNTTTTVYSLQSGLPTRSYDAYQHETQFEYTNSRLTSQIDPQGNVMSFGYDANGNRNSQTVRRTNALGQQEVITTTFLFDNLNRLVKTTFADGSFIRAEYNELGQKKATIDQAGRRTEYEYDLLGRPIKTTYPDGRFEESTYDNEGRRLTAKDRAGHLTTYEYDLLGRPKKTIFPDGTFTLTTYDAAGRVATSTDARSNVTTYTYDDSGRRLTVKDALDQVTSFGYDANGNQTSMTDARNNTTAYVYDDANRRTRVNFADSSFTETTYDKLGRRTSEKDQAGKVTQFVYDSLGRMTKVIDALNQETRYEYNEIGQQTKQIDAMNRETKYEYDKLGRRTKRVLPLGQFETYAYNIAGDLETRTDFNGKTTTFGYDTMRRLLSKSPDASLGQPSVTFTYNALGQRATMTDASGLTTYGYDNRNRLASKQTPVGTLTYTYNAAGNIETLRSSNANGVSVDYTYDDVNRLESAIDNRLPQGSNTTSYGYDAAGNLESYIYPNQVATTYVYNNLNRLSSMGVSKGATTLASYAYTLGAAGNRTQVIEAGGRTVNYVYDDLYRLTRETVSNAATSGQVDYQYDAVGNRLNRTSTVGGLSNQAPTYDNNDRLNSDGYDANGNTLTANSRTFNYDFENKLTSTSDGVTVVYDGDGNRVSKTVAGVTTFYLVDTNNLTGYAQVVEELRSGVGVVKSYTYGLDLISQRQGSSVHFYGYDGHGSVRQLTDASGNITDSYAYDAYGTLIERTGTTSNDYLYAGEQFDPDLGFYYNRARYLNVETGRFISQDTFEGSMNEPLSLHKYLYGNANPVSMVDPSGNFGLQEGLIVVGIAAVIATISIGVYYVKFKKFPIRVSWEWKNDWSDLSGGQFSAGEADSIKNVAYATFDKAFTGFNVRHVDGPGGDRSVTVSNLFTGDMGQTFPVSTGSTVYYPSVKAVLWNILKHNNLTKSRAEIAEGLGRGIGATAAHELGHQRGLEFSGHDPAQGFYNTGSVNETGVDHFFGELRWTDYAMTAMNDVLSKAE